MTKEAKFWDKVAEKYARDPIKDMDAYTYTLERSRSYLKPTDTVLEIGCGTGSTALLLAETVGEYHGTDISSEMIAIARRKVAETSIPNLSFEVSTVEDALAQDQTVNVICAFSILHLIRDLRGTLKSAADSLPEGGLLISKTPCLRSMGFGMKVAIKIALPLMQLLGKAPFVHNLNTDEIVKMLEEVGFEILETVPSPKGAHHYVVARKI